MVNVRLAKKIREVAPKEWDKLYENLVVKKIREKYSINEELAILRQRDEKPSEFAEYHAYVEECKAAAKEELEI
jgi:hypothetical protein